MHADGGGIEALPVRHFDIIDSGHLAVSNAFSDLESPARCVFVRTCRGNRRINSDLVADQQISALTSDIYDDFFLGIFAGFKKLIVDVGVVVDVEVARALSVLDRSSLGFLDRIELGNAHFLGLFFGLEVKETRLGTGRGAHGDPEQGHCGYDFANAMGFHLWIFENKSDIAVLVFAKLLELVVVG